jgi:hypothetical protein
MPNPYTDLSPNAYWRTAVAETDPMTPGDLYQPKFEITPETAILTVGSCFAQHVGKALRGAEFNVIDTESLPDAVSDSVAQRFGYRMYSARYGNVYTMRQLLQLLREARGKFTPEDAVWEKDSRFFDAMRPAVEPEGLDTADLVNSHRTSHLLLTRRAFFKADVVVLTLGLTEAWMHRASETVYPTAPGVIASAYDPDIHVFKKFRYDEIIKDFLTFRKMLQQRNPAVKFLLTVSPVPLTATASGQHVEVATAHSKAVLRAVCGALYDDYDDVDYFPSYEAITSAKSGGAYFTENRRSVTKEGVAKAMRMFLSAHGAPVPDDTDDAPAKLSIPNAYAKAEADAQCEDVLLEAFSK